jgi:hypothetical protein
VNVGCAERIVLTVPGTDLWTHAALAPGERVQAELPMSVLGSLDTLEMPHDHAEPRAQLRWRDRYDLAYALSKPLMLTHSGQDSLSLGTREAGFLVRPRLPLMTLWKLPHAVDDADY